MNDWNNLHAALLGGNLSAARFVYKVLLIDCDINRIIIFLNIKLKGGTHD